MGKFRRHHLFYCKQQSQRKCFQGKNFFIVPYQKMHDDFKNGLLLDAEVFKKTWLENLKVASDDFDSNLQCIWERIMVKTQESHPNLIGALPEEALEYYVSICGVECLSTLLIDFQHLHCLAMMNAESLRKLVRKFDKKTSRESGKSMSSTLLPRLFSTSFMMATSNLVNIIAFIQECLDIKEGNSSDKSYASGNSSVDEEVEIRRAEELEWFNENVKDLSVLDVNTLVAHRGFHMDPIYRSDIRPLENTLASFEQTWTAGISMCECDVALTKDGKIVLAHDKNFSRLALLADSSLSIMQVNDLTLREIFSLPLKGGTRPPLLIDVLRSAQMIGEHAKLIIEIKPGNVEMCSPLINLFAKFPEFLSHVQAIMSFDSYIMKEISLQMRNLSTTLNATEENSNLRKSMTQQKDSILNRSFRRVFTSSNIINQIAAIPLQNTPSQVLLTSITDVVETDNIKKTTIQMPKLLLVVVNTPRPSGTKFCVNIKDFSIIESWMEESFLDGVYLEYEPEMLDPQGIEAMRDLAKSYEVGVWMDAKKHPDRLSIARKLVNECYVGYVNTDFPQDFFST